MIKIPQVQVPITGINDEKKQTIPQAIPKMTSEPPHIAQIKAYPMPKTTAQIIRAIKLIIPATIHNPHTTNPTYGINAKHKANPSMHPKPNITIGKVSRGTKIIMTPIKRILIRR